MASLGPNAQKRYYQAQSPSTTHLLSPTPSPQGVQAALAQTPVSVRSITSDASLVRLYSPTAPPTASNKITSPTQNDSRYVSGKASMPSISDKFSLSPDPSSWGANLSMDYPEQDDYLHNPDPRRDRKYDEAGNIFTGRGFTNLGCVIILVTGLLALFAGYPIIRHFSQHEQASFGGFNLGGINASGQVPSMAGNFGLIDVDTPTNVYTKADYVNGKNWQLIFSDEFNVDGRSFYPGDDPYWEAVDLHYWQTNNMEWYDPAAITTKDGSLVITLSEKETHDLHYQGGMMSTWNKFCFTGGLIEASVVLPGVNNVVGLWPAIWTMGNLGRAGYGASLEGMWPYTYDSCDVGTVKNQTNKGLPVAATINGDPTEDGALSFLPGQRLSRCTCAGESHPGPIHADGTYVGRAAPEIDVFEAQITGKPLTGQVSQSSQWAPFNNEYVWFNTSDNLIIPNADTSFLNTYRGGAFQQATSVVTECNQQAYELTGGVYETYGFQYKPGFDGAYITWISGGNVAWTLKQAGMAADTVVEIGSRPVPQEPMVDWIRVYQDPDAINYGCDPSDFPTQAYINQYIEAYTNPNLTTWVDDFKQPFPKNRFLGEC